MADETALIRPTRDVHFSITRQLDSERIDEADYVIFRLDQLRNHNLRLTEPFILEAFAT